MKYLQISFGGFVLVGSFVREYVLVIQVKLSYEAVLWLQDTQTLSWVVVFDNERQRAGKFLMQIGGWRMKRFDCLFLVEEQGLATYGEI